MQSGLSCIVSATYHSDFQQETHISPSVRSEWHRKSGWADVPNDSEETHKLEAKPYSI